MHKVVSLGLVPLLTITMLAGPAMAGIDVEAPTTGDAPLSPEDDPGTYNVLTDNPSSLSADGTYGNVFVTVQDELFGMEAAFSLCAHAPGNDVCDETGTSGELGCDGKRTLLQIPAGTDQVTATFMPLFVKEDLAFCGATQGTWSAIFF